MSLFASAGRIKTAGLICLLLIFGTAPAMFAQRSPSRSIVRVDVDDSPFLGIQMKDVTADNVAQYKLPGERGAIVESVEKGSPAEAAGLRENDVVLEYAGQQVLSTMQLARMVRETPTGRKVEIVVSRDGKRLNLTAQIGKREGPLTSEKGVVIEPFDRGFQFFGPNGRSFQFRGPEGRGFMFDMPDRVFSFSRPRLGVTVEALTDQMAEFLGVPGKKGLLVTSVDPGSPAASKLRAGDVITRAANQEVSNPEDLVRIVQGKDDGSIDLRVVRDKKELAVTVDMPKTDSKAPARGFRL